MAVADVEVSAFFWRIVRGLYSWATIQTRKALSRLMPREVQRDVFLVQLSDALGRKARPMPNYNVSVHDQSE